MSFSTQSPFIVKAKLWHQNDIEKYMTDKKLKAFARVEKNQDKKSMEILESFSTPSPTSVKRRTYRKKIIGI